MRRRDLLAGGALTALAGLLPRSARGEGGLHVQLTTPQDFSTPPDAFATLFTPNERFFVRSHFGAPAYKPDRKLRVAGKQVLELAAKDLEAMPQTSVTAVLQCAGNGRSLHAPRVPGVQWVHGAMGQAEWRGVRLKDLLEKAGLSPEQRHVKLQGADIAPKPTTPAYVRSIPIAKALEATTIVATHMNGKPLPHAHGAPFRLIVPGWSGNHWMKWLRHIQPQAAEADGFYQQTAYRMPKQPVAPGGAVKPADTNPASTFPLKSVIARPGEGGVVAPGPAEVVGVAFSGEAAVAKVEVSLDGGASWQRAKLEGEPGVGRWQIFRLPFEAKPGQVRALVRATDEKGVTQPEKAVWNPSGYFWNGWHQVSFKVQS